MKQWTKWTAVAAALTGLAGSASAGYVDSLSREWLPLTTVTGYSWDQIDAVCQNNAEAAGACGGSLGSVDLTGWTWASRDDVLALMGEFMVAAGDSTPVSAIASTHGYGTSVYRWAEAITAAMDITAPGLDSRTFGFTSTNYYYAWVCHGGPCGWQSYAAASERYGGASDFFGGWFYRASGTTGHVPEPSSTALLLAAGAAVLLNRLSRRRVARRA